MSENEEKIIKLNELDPNFKYEIQAEPGGENFTRCFACGTCTNGCPIREVDEKYNPRKIIRMALLGMKDKVFKSEFVWLCSAHFTCFERCPQGVNIGEITNTIRNIATREEHHFSDSLNSSLNKEEVIKFGELDSNFKYEVAQEHGGESITCCFACGSCTTNCPERARDDRYNPRRFIRMVLLGMKERVFQDPFLWLCSIHYRCSQRCPQEVNIKEIMNAIKNIAIREGYTSPLLTLRDETGDKQERRKK